MKQQVIVIHQVYKQYNPYSMINSFLLANNVKPADTVVLQDQLGILHYALFLDWENQSPRLIGNINSGVEIIDTKRMADFEGTLELKSVEKFPGSAWQRRDAIRRALSRVGEKAYNLIFNNCEHFKNWVWHVKSSSRQVENIGGTSAATGAAFLLIGLATGNKNSQKIGKIVLLAVVLIFLIAFFFVLAESKKDRDTPLN